MRRGSADSCDDQVFRSTAVVLEDLDGRFGVACPCAIAVIVDFVDQTPGYHLVHPGLYADA